ncbi:MAG: hypothetical protein LHV68_09440 [Elusimicrobia bacterium]|nr:hypothetical protein [Candidatus Liberimonas magnetica]
MKMALFKRLLLIFVGIFIGLLAGELCLKIFKGVPPVAARSKTDHYDDIYWKYVDIYEPYFKKNNKTHVYETQRPFAFNNSSFPAIKPANEKRIFIIGESVAGRFESEKEYFEHKLSSLLPYYKWSIINCGMPGYDAYRIKLIAKEIVNYKPDLIILMMGNNCPFVPETINHWKYKYAILGSFWVTSIITDRLKPSLDIRNKGLEYFCKELYEMIGIAKSRSIPLLISTLPNNIKLVNYQYDTDEKKFKNYWLLWHRPQMIFNNKSNDDISRAKALENMGKSHEAEILYKRRGYRNLGAWKNNLILKEVAGRDRNVMLFDFEKYLMEIGKKESTGFDYFSDKVHYWPYVYRLYVDNLAKAIYQYNDAMSKNILDNNMKWRKEGFAEVKPEDVLKHNRMDLIGKAKKILNGEERVNKNYDFAALVQMLVAAYKTDPEVFEGMKYLNKKSELQDDECFNLVLTAEALRLVKKYHDAIRCLNAGIRMKDSEYLGYFIRGLVKYEMNDRQGAEADFNKLHELKQGYGWVKVVSLDSFSENGQL